MSNGNAPLRLGRVLVFGFLAEVGTVLLIVFTLTFHARVIAAGQPQAVTQAFAHRASLVLGPVAGALFTFGTAIRASRPLEARFRVHGVLVGLVTSLLTIPGLLAAPSSARPVYVLAILLKLVAGFSGGALSEQRHISSARSAPKIAG